MKILVIGCGNIGAMYDYHTDEVHTHVKAFHHLGYQVDFIEPRDDIAGMVKKKYGFQRREFFKLNLSDYNIISISTPTEHHSFYLLAAIEAKVPVVICEKPITYSIDELKKLIKAYNLGQTKVIVNYIRRFQESYSWLKNEILNLQEPLQSIHCNYHKGLLNSAGHAIDLVQFLTSFELKHKNIVEIGRNYDYFRNDPTISFAGYQDNVQYFFRGLSISYQIFELDFIFNSYRISLTDSGKEARIFYKNDLLLYKNEMIKNYMIDVANKAIKLITGQDKKDNFQESVSLNKILIKIINK